MFSVPGCNLIQGVTETKLPRFILDPFMSITPLHTQGSNCSSSSSSTLLPNFNHGSNFSQSQSSPSIQDSQLDTISVSSHMDPGSKESAGFSYEASEVGTSRGEKSLSDENIRTSASGHGEMGSLLSRGNLPRTAGSLRSKKSNGSSNNPRETTPQPAGRKNQSMNGNHLLNFHYNPTTRPQVRAPPPPRRQPKVKPYNKDLFLQANFKFVVLDSGHYTPETMDPDKMLKWEDIICVRYSTPFPVQCPICLDHPLCPQITSCGHIFCFPCILQYLLMGDEDNEGNCWKRCPLCFVMISPKELYTISIEDVKRYSVGDTIEFMLLNRQKDSSAISRKNKLEIDDTVSSCDDTVYDSFAKLTFTSDVELSVRKAISDLDSWLVKADSGLVDDIEKLPYVCAAMEQLDQRKKYWNEARSSYGNKYTGSQTRTKAVQLNSNANNFHHEGAFAQAALSNNISVQNKGMSKMTSDVLGGPCSPKYDDGAQSLRVEDQLLSSNGAIKSSRGDLEDSRDIRDEYSYNYYQAVDGQHFILHPLNMQCLLHHYGNTDIIPHRITGKILQLETVTQTEAMRKRYRYLSHFSLTTTFQLCEIDMSEMLPPAALSPFMDEIKKRQNQRKRLAVKEEKEKIKAEAASDDYYVALRSNTEPFYYGDSPTFTVDDFEALGSSPVTSTSPPTVWGGTLFSNVTRLGYAAAHDSPALKIHEAHSSQNTETTSPALAAGSRNAGGLSFAKILTKDKTKETTDAPKLNEIGKKGKKPTRVLLSTAGGLRY